MRRPSLERFLDPLELLLLVFQLLLFRGERQAQFEDEEATRLSVENQSSLDMNIYVLRGSQRIRLGTATAHLTTRFTIPSELIFGIRT